MNRLASHSRPKTALATAFLTLALSLPAHAVSVLVPGDMAIIGYNGKGDESFAAVSFVHIDAGVAIRFNSSNTGGNVTWTVPAGGMATGMVVVIQNPKNDATPASASLGGTLVEGLYDYSSGGDAVVIYHGTNAIYASESLSTAYTIPPGLSAGAFTVVAHPNTGPARGGRYKSTALRAGTRTTLLQAIQSTNNWDYYTADLDASAYNFNTAPYTNAFAVTPTVGTAWSSIVVDGWRFALNPSPPGGSRLSTNAAALVSIQTDSNNIPADVLCFADKADTIALNEGFSVYFASTVPAGSTILSAKIHVQHAGAASQSGALQIHVSDNRFSTSWYNGISTNLSVANSGDVAWSATEAEAIYDVTSVLNSADKLNNCEVIVLNRNTSTARVYFDYIWIEAIYIGSGAPSIDNAPGATAILSSSATLNGNVLAGSPSPNVWIGWGDNSGGTSLGSWDTVENLGVVGVGPFARAISSLTASKTYFYRCFASNSLGSAWASTNATFATAPATVQFTAASNSGPEANTNIVIGLSLNATSTLPVTVTVSASGGTASSPSDYTFAITNVTIPAGQIAASVSLALADDAADENDETVVLSLSAPSGATIGANTQHTFTIIDNDTLPIITFSPSASFNANEASNNAVITLSLNAVPGRDVTVQYQTLDGDALAGSDYSNTAGTVTWPEGDNTQKIILVPMINNATPESPEQFYVPLFNPSNAVIGGAATATVTIADDDLGPPAVINDPGPTAVSSNAATLRGELLSAGGSPTVVRIYYGLTDGGITNALWTTNALIGTVPEGLFSNRVTGLLTNRTYYYRCTASNVFGATWAPSSTNWFTGPPTVTFLAASSSGLEGTSPVLLPIQLTAPGVYGDDVIVNYARTGGSATTVTDFNLPATTVTIRAGMTLTNIALNLVSDALSENNEHVVITLATPANARLASPTAHDFTITDDDPLPQILFVGTPYSVSENATSITVRVKLNVPAGRSVDANYTTVDGTALANIHYQARTGEVQWATGSTITNTVTIPITNDAISTGDRAFEFRLVATGNDIDLTNVTDRVTIAIIEDDFTPPQVSNGTGPTDVRSSMAILNGTILAGVPPPQTRIYWGTSDGGTTPAAWGRTNLLGAQTGTFSSEIYSLLPATTYFYRCFASNTVGTAWAAATTNFNTTGGDDYFVNDTSTSNDVYCTALGNDANSGTSPNDPMATVQMLVDTYDLAPGDTVFIDTGTYNLTATLAILNDDIGAPGLGNELLFRGSPHAAGSLLNRGASSSDVLSLTGVSADTYVTFARLRVTGGRRGIVVLGDSFDPARGLVVKDCIVHNNSPGGTGNQGALVLRNCLDSLVLNCTVFSNAISGITIDNCTGSSAVSNRVFQNQTRGIRVRGSSTPTIANNDSSGQAYGIQFENSFGGELIRGNVVCSNSIDGINMISDSGVIESNRVFANGADGLNLSGPNLTVRGNTFFNNGGDGFETAADQGIACLNNLFYDNTNRHVNFSGAGNLVLFENNTLYGGNGVYFEDPLAVTNRHNIIWSSGAGKVAIDIHGSQTDESAALVSDYNCLLATSSANVGILSDSAADTAYDGGWADDSSGSYGFGPWTHTASGPTTSFFTGLSTNNANQVAPGIDTNERAWGMSASGGSYATAYRQASVPVGGSLGLSLDNGFVDNSQSVGFVLRHGNAASSPSDYNAGARLEFFFLGGSANYSLVDSLGLRNTGIGFTATGLQLTFALGTNDSYALSIVNANGITNTITGTLGGTPGASLDSIALYNRNAGFGIAFDAYFNSLRIVAPTAAAWRNAILQDANSLGSDPLFASVPLADFHLQSKAGSYHGGLWTLDATNSPCIDAGSPGAIFALEPDYNGLRRNLGAYGNTAQASKTYYTGLFYPLSLAASPPEAGAVYIQPQAALYPTNVPVTIWSEVTNATYEWSGWTGSLVTATITNTFYVTNNMTITGRFVFEAGTNYNGPYYSLTLNRAPVEAGSVSVTPVLATYPTNLPVTVWATVTNGAYAWQNWTGALQTATITNTFYVTTNMTCTAIFAVAVNNTNGVPGSWLMAYGIPNDQSGANADSDGDSMLNWEEYYAGTIPTNIASLLKATLAARAFQRDSFTFLSITGKQYRVQLSSNLPSRVWVYWPAALTTNGATSLTPVTGTASVMTVYMDPPTNLPRMYRLDLNYTN